MAYQKIANLLDNTLNQPSKFRKKNWVEINDESRGIKSLCDYSDAYILAKGNISVNNTASADADE